MPSHKALGAVAHNIGQSFISIGSHFGDNSWPIQHLLLAARAAGESRVEIDLLSGRVAPAAVCTPPVGRSVEHLLRHFRDMIIRSGSSPEFVAAASLAVEFRLSEKLSGKPAGHLFGAGVIVPEMVPHDCVVELVDDRGKKYVGRPKEWWLV